MRINGNGVQFTYDASEHKAEGFTFEIIDASGMYTRDDFELIGTEAIVKATDAGTYSMALTAANFRNINNKYKTI